MDKPFPAHKWVPSRLYAPGETPLSDDTVSALIDLLSRETGTIKRHPYDPSSWLRRAKTLTALRYPELAAGDALKAEMLCQNLLGKLGGGWRVGSRMRFWMKDEGDGEEYERQREYVMALQRQAIKLLEENLYLYPEEDEGICVLRLYPWVEERHSWRSDELVQKLNREFEDGRNRGEGVKGPCVLERYAFGKGVGARNGEDLLGVFAKRDLRKGEVVVVDETRVWGCNGPGKDGTTANLFGGIACMDLVHPNTDDETMDLRWIRDRCGKRAVEVLIKVRLLMCAIDDGATHPLDHHLIACLTPTYRKEHFKRFSLDRDITILNETLQKCGIDIFANLNFDTWVFFILMARVANNSWSDPHTGAINPLFSMFNHACDPNMKWQIPDDHRTMSMWTLRDVKKGEQLFVTYNSFVADEPLAKRRKTFWRWLDGPCQCTRCLREEAEMKDSGGSSPNSSFSESCSEGDWDTDPKPAFPEDEIDLESRLSRWGF